MLTQETLLEYLEVVGDTDGSYPQEAMMEVFKYGDIESLPMKVHVDLLNKLKIAGDRFEVWGAVRSYTESPMTIDLIKELGEEGYTTRLKDIFIPMIRKTAKHLGTSYVEFEGKGIYQDMVVSTWHKIQDDFETVMLYYGFDYSFHPGFASDKSIVRREFSQAVISQFPPDKKDTYIDDWNKKGYGLMP